MLSMNFRTLNFQKYFWQVPNWSQETLAFGWPSPGTMHQTTFFALFVLSVAFCYGSVQGKSFPFNPINKPGRLWQGREGHTYLKTNKFIASSEVNRIFCSQSCFQHSTFKNEVYMFDRINILPNDSARLGWIHVEARDHIPPNVYLNFCCSMI